MEREGKQLGSLAGFCFCFSEEHTNMHNSIYWAAAGNIQLRITFTISTFDQVLGYFMDLEQERSIPACQQRCHILTTSPYHYHRRTHAHTHMRTHTNTHIHTSKTHTQNSKQRASISIQSTAEMRTGIPSHSRSRGLTPAAQLKECQVRDL